MSHPPSAGIRTLHSADRNGKTYVYANFQANDDPALKLALCTRRTTEYAQHISRLAPT